MIVVAVVAPFIPAITYAVKSWIYMSFGWPSRWVVWKIASRATSDDWSSRLDCDVDVPSLLISLLFGWYDWFQYNHVVLSVGSTPTSTCQKSQFVVQSDWTIIVLSPLIAYLIVEGPHTSYWTIISSLPPDCCVEYEFLFGNRCPA